MLKANISNIQQIIKLPCIPLSQHNIEKPFHMKVVQRECLCNYLVRNFANLLLVIHVIVNGGCQKSWCQ